MATLSQMGIPGVGSGILHPKLKDKFRITFQNLGKLVPGVNSRDISMQMNTTDLPKISWEKIEQHRYNSKATILGKHSWEDLNVVVEDDITGLATKAIEAQMETQQRLVGGDLDGRWLNTAATGSDYKFACRIDQLDGNEGVVSSWIIESTSMSNVDFGDRDYSASEKATISFVLTFDHAYKINTGDGYGTALGGNYN